MNLGRKTIWSDAKNDARNFITISKLNEKSMTFCWWEEIKKLGFFISNRRFDM